MRFSGVRAGFSYMQVLKNKVAESPRGAYVLGTPFHFESAFLVSVDLVGGNRCVIATPSNDYAFSLETLFITSSFKEAIIVELLLCSDIQTAFPRTGIHTCLRYMYRYYNKYQQELIFEARCQRHVDAVGAS